MKAKPKGQRAKYRHLMARGGTIYYQRQVGEKRVRFSLETADWDEAAKARDLYEAKRGIGRVPAPILEVPRFGDAADRYLKEATAHLSPSTKEDRDALLGEGGRLRPHFEVLRLDEITRPRLLEWWHAEIEAAGRSSRTGLNYLSALSAVFGHAQDLEQVAENPVDALRATLRRKRRSKQGRAEAAGAHVHPIESGEALAAFVKASTELGQAHHHKRARQDRDGHIADILQLDAGLRLGEVAGLRWRNIQWGESPDDTRRHLRIAESVSRDRHEGATKSGRERRVALSRRVRSTLRAHWLVCGQPAGGERVLPRFHASNYRTRHFADVLERAKLTGYTPKDLRDTFGSWLVSLGVPLGYVSRQLGHADLATTARHYARYIEEEVYREPAALDPGEVPADLLARLSYPSVTPAAASGDSEGA